MLLDFELVCKPVKRTLHILVSYMHRNGSWLDCVFYIANSFQDSGLVHTTKVESTFLIRRIEFCGTLVDIYKFCRITNALTELKTRKYTYYTSIGPLNPQDKSFTYARVRVRVSVHRAHTQLSSRSRFGIAHQSAMLKRTYILLL